MRISPEFLPDITSYNLRFKNSVSQKLGNKVYYSPVHLVQDLPSVLLYLIFEKSSLKNQVQRTGFLVYFVLDFYCLCSLQKSISKLIFAG